MTPTPKSTTRNISDPWPLDGTPWLSTACRWTSYLYSLGEGEREMQHERGGRRIGGWGYLPWSGFVQCQLKTVCWQWWDWNKDGSAGWSDEIAVSWNTHAMRSIQSILPISIGSGGNDIKERAGINAWQTGTRFIKDIQKRSRSWMYYSKNPWLGRPINDITRGETNVWFPTPVRPSAILLNGLLTHVFLLLYYR